MKTSSATTLSVISLSLVLCACDSGDKKDSGAAPTVPKKPKAASEAAEAGTAANPQPPEPGDAPKGMNAPAESAGPAELPETSDEKQQIEMLNMAVGRFSQKQMTVGMDKFGRPGGGKTPLTSLDQLVKAGVLKAIPAAPAGKKFVLDLTTQKVKLAPK